MILVNLPIKDEEDLAFLTREVVIETIEDTKIRVGRALLEKCEKSEKTCDDCALYDGGCQIIKICFSEGLK